MDWALQVANASCHPCRHYEDTGTPNGREHEQAINASQKDDVPLRTKVKQCAKEEDEELKYVGKG